MGQHDNYGFALAAQPGGSQGRPVKVVAVTLRQEAQRSNRFQVRHGMHFAFQINLKELYLSTLWGRIGFGLQHLGLRIQALIFGECRG